MKIPLHYQVSNYDCGPTSLVNALSVLFEREDIPPELIRNIMLYCLDCYNLQGEEGRSGTSRLAMMYFRGSGIMSSPTTCFISTMSQS